MKLQQLICEKESKLNDTDLGILNYIVQNNLNLRDIGINRLAELTYSSKSSVLRMTKKLGFSGYSEFKYFLSYISNDKGNVKFDSRSIYQQQLDDVKKTLKDLDKTDMDSILSMFFDAETIYLYATGFSQRLAIEELYIKLLSLNKKCIIISNKTELDMVTTMVTEKDVVIVASLSGETEKVKPNLVSFGLKNIPVLTITLPGDNYFSRHSSFNLHYYAGFFPGGKEEKPTQSMLGLHCVMDYLYRMYNEYIRNI